MATHRTGPWRIFFACALVLTCLAGLRPTPVAAADRIVTNTDNSGAGSLRQAISDATNGDTIKFNLPGSAPWTITVTNSLNISKGVTIQGPGASNLIVSGGAATPIFSIGGSQPVVISGLTIRDGKSDTAGFAAGINNAGRLTLDTIIATSNDGLGAAVRNSQGTLTINNSTFTDNQGGGVSSFNGTASVNNSTFERNAGGGGLEASGSGDLTIRTSTFRFNSGSSGGGVGALNSGSTTISDSTFANNLASAGGGIAHVGGPLTLTDSIISGNLAPGNGAGRTGGGGLFTSGEATVSNSSVTGNGTGSTGGGIATNTKLILNNSTISGNSADFGGGGISAAGDLTVTNTTISGNTSQLTEQYGIQIAMFNLSVPFTIALTNVTISQNGGAGISGGGSALHVSVSGQFANVAIDLNHLTVANHNGSTGAFFISASNGATVTTTLRNSIVAANAVNFAGGGITSGGRNISSDNSGAGFLIATGDLNATDPQLAAAGLANNGGAVQTIALQSTSPAIDRVPTSGAGCPAADARGFVRPFGAGCDSGAFEFGASAPPSATPSASASASPSASASASPSPSPCVSGFADVPSGHPACAAIAALTAEGVIRGYATTPPTFGPDDPVQRSQVAAFLVRALDWEARTTEPRDFSDLRNPNDPLQRAALILANACDDQGNCVARGYRDGRFGPHDRVTYAQVVSFIARAFRLDPNTGWQLQPNGAFPYQNFPAEHQGDLRTYHHHAGTLPDAPTTLGGWQTPAPRAWIALVLYQAFQSVP